MSVLNQVGSYLRQILRRWKAQESRYWEVCPSPTSELGFGVVSGPDRRVTGSEYKHRKMTVEHISLCVPLTSLET